MHPPQLLGVDTEFFVSGTADRHRDVPDDLRRRLLAWTASRMRDGAFPLARFYPDVAAAGGGSSGAAGSSSPRAARS